MRKPIRCAGYVVAGAGLVVLIGAALFVVIGLLVLLAETIRVAADLPDKAGGPIFMLILFAIIGGCFGAAACKVN